MSIMITGQAGFIGSHFTDLIRDLSSKINHYDFIFVDKGTYAANPDYVFNGYRYAYVIDIADIEQMTALFKTYHIHKVINFAAETHVHNSIRDDRSFIDTNIIGVVNLLKLCEKFGPIHFHQISTDEVYGSVDSPSPEVHPYDPKNPYAASKAAADHFVGAYRNTYKVDATISRCGNNFGPRQHDEKFIPTVIRNILMDKPIPVYGDGKNRREWLYVKDHARMVYEFVTNRRNYSSINLGPGRSMSNLEIIAEIGNLIKTMYPTVIEYPKIEFVTDRKGHDRNYRLDCSEFMKHYKVQQTPFHEAMRETIEYYYKRYNV